jgi:hypothetical protein
MTSQLETAGLIKSPAVFLHLALIRHCLGQLILMLTVTTFGVLPGHAAQGPAEDALHPNSHSNTQHITSLRVDKLELLVPPGRLIAPYLVLAPIVVA